MNTEIESRDETTRGNAEPRAGLNDAIREMIRKHPAYPRICLSCGAHESLDGALPCGH